MIALWLMFSAAFIAATIFPGGSEVLLAALIKEQPDLWISLVFVATLGNSLGSVTNYGLGYLGRFAKTPEEMATGRFRYSVNLLKKYGYWSLLLAWLPIVGDLLCLLAGWMKMPIVQSTLMIFVGKGIRYLLIAAVAFKWL